MPRIHVETLRVRFGDTDQMGIVYYANYLRYFEAARVEWLRVNGMPYQMIEAQGIQFPVIEAHARYRQPARFDDLLLVECQPTEVKTVTVRFAYKVRLAAVSGDGDADAKLLVEGYTAHASVDGAGKLCRLPENLRALFAGPAPAAAASEKNSQGAQK